MVPPPVAVIDDTAVDLPREFGHSNGVIGKEHQWSSPYGGRQRRLPPPDCFHSDARLGMARTNPTSCAWRASSRSGRGASQSRVGALQESRRPWPVPAWTSTRVREAASLSPEAAN